MNRFKAVVLAIAMVSSVSLPAFADIDRENVDLARINSILNTVYPLIHDAEKQADPNARVEFHYDWLESDLQQIQTGIAAKINEQYLQPRAITPLTTHFVIQQNAISR